MAERSEAKSAERSFTSKIKILDIRNAQLFFLANFKWIIYWTDDPQRLFSFSIKIYRN